MSLCRVFSYISGRWSVARVLTAEGFRRLRGFPPATISNCLQLWPANKHCHKDIYSITQKYTTFCLLLYNLRRSALPQRSSLSTRSSSRSFEDVLLLSMWKLFISVSSFSRVTRVMYIVKSHVSPSRELASDPSSFTTLSYALFPHQTLAAALLSDPSPLFAFLSRGQHGLLLPKTAEYVGNLRSSCVSTAPQD